MPVEVGALFEISWHTFNGIKEYRCGVPVQAAFLKYCINPKPVEALKIEVLGMVVAEQLKEFEEM
jgi:hypothetical protein